MSSRSSSTSSSTSSTTTGETYARCDGPRRGHTQVLRPARGAQGHLLHPREGTGAVDHRALGQRQEHAAEDNNPAGEGRRRHSRDRRRAPLRGCALRPPRQPAAHRIGLAAAVCCEGCFIRPGGRSVEEGRHGDSPGTRKGYKLREAFVKRSSHSRRIPDEVPNAEGRKRLARIPGDKAGDAAGAFILPDAFAQAGKIDLRLHGSRAPRRRCCCRSKGAKSAGSRCT